MEKLEVYKLTNSKFRSHRTHKLYHDIYNSSTCYFTYAVFCDAFTSFSSILFILSFMVSFASSLKCTLTQYTVPPICFLSATGVFAFLFSICLLSFCVNARQGSASIFRQPTTTTDTKKLLILIFYSFIFTFKLFFIYSVVFVVRTIYTLKKYSKYKGFNNIEPTTNPTTKVATNRQPIGQSLL